jgi:hypothetical protein
MEITEEYYEAVVLYYELNEPDEDAEHLAMITCIAVESGLATFDFETGWMTRV